MNLIGTHVNWTKLKGKSNPSMHETKGFGSLYILEVGKRMYIVGDYGVTTTEVKEIREGDDGILVYTQNSVYLIEKWR